MAASFFESRGTNMKFEQEQAAFHPVLITLESEEEVARLAVLLGRTIDNDSHLFADLYSLLGGIVHHRDNPFRVIHTSAGPLMVVRK